MKVEKNFVQFLELFKDKFKEILDLDLEVKEEKNENRPSAANLKEEEKPEAKNSPQ